MHQNDDTLSSIPPRASQQPVSTGPLRLVRPPVGWDTLLTLKRNLYHSSHLLSSHLTLDAIHHSSSALIHFFFLPSLFSTLSFLKFALIPVEMTTWKINPTLYNRQSTDNLFSLSCLSPLWVPIPNARYPPSLPPSLPSFLRSSLSTSSTLSPQHSLFPLFSLFSQRYFRIQKFQNPFEIFSTTR